MTAVSRLPEARQEGEPLSFAADRHAAAEGGVGMAQGEGAVPTYRSTAERLALIWPDDPLTVDRLVCAGFDVVGWWPLGDLPVVTL